MTLPRSRQPVLSEADVEQFWSLVDKSGDCWLWKGALTNRNYGRIRFGKDQWLAPRIAWFIAHGDLPSELFVCHHCDNPPCVRPDHLFLGTNHDNIADMVSKGRRLGVRRGEGTNLHKLKTEQVAEIKQQLRNGTPRRELANRYGVDKSTIMKIHKGTTWSHV